MSDFYIEGFDYDGEWPRALREGRVLIEEYRDILGQQIYSPRIDRDQQQLDAAKREIDELRYIKMRMLFALFGINPRKLGLAAAWEQLIDALLTQHVPGFRVVYKPPPPVKENTRKKYTELEWARLVVGVDRAMRENAAVGKDTTIAAAVETALEAGYFGELAYMNGKGNRTRMGAGSMVSRCKEAMGRWKDVPLEQRAIGPAPYAGIAR